VASAATVNVPPVLTDDGTSAATLAFALEAAVDDDADVVAEALALEVDLLLPPQPATAKVLSTAPIATNQFLRLDI
jgi:hypothetical protein